MHTLVLAVIFKHFHASGHVSTRLHASEGVGLFQPNEFCHRFTFFKFILDKSCNCFGFDISFVPERIEVFLGETSM